MVHCILDFGWDLHVWRYSIFNIRNGKNVIVEFGTQLRRNKWYFNERIGSDETVEKFYKFLMI